MNLNTIGILALVGKANKQTTFLIDEAEMLYSYVANP